MSLSYLLANFVALISVFHECEWISCLRSGLLKNDVTLFTELNSAEITGQLKLKKIGTKTSRAQHSANTFFCETGFWLILQIKITKITNKNKLELATKFGL